MGKSLAQMLHIDNSGNMLMTMDGLTIQKDASGNTQLNLDGLIISKDPSGGAIDYSLVKNKPVIREADLKVQVPVGTMMSYIGNDYIDDPTFVKPGTVVNRNDYIELANTIGIPKSQSTFTVPSIPTDWNSITNNPFTSDNGIGISTNVNIINMGTDTGLIVNQKGIGDVVDFKYQDSTVLKIVDGGNVGIGTSNPVSGVDMSKTISSLVLPTGNTTQRPTINVPGQVRHNNFHNMIESYNGVTWNGVQHSALPPIDNMMVYWDAANTLSYPGSGNIVNSLVSPNITGTLNNVTFSDGAFVFNGVNSYIDATLNNPAGAWAHSISFWMQMSYDQITSRMDPFQIGSTATTSKYSAMDINNGSLNWYFYSNDASYTGNIFKKNVWYHIVLTYAGGYANSSNKFMFINTVNYPLSSTSTTPLDIDANAVMSIGRDRTRDISYFAGKIANFQIFNRVLTPVEVTNMYYTMKPRFNIPIWYAPGTIVQHQGYNTVLNASTTSTTFVPSGLYINITPRFATSKILVSFTMTMHSSVGGNGMGVTIWRGINGGNMTKVYYGGGHDLFFYLDNGSYVSNMHSRAVANFIDLPQTTSLCRYEIYIRSYTGGTINLGNGNNSMGDINAFEIAQ